MSGHKPATGDPSTLPADVLLTQLQTHRDSRGSLTEIFRNEWFTSPRPLQWSANWTEPNVLRGVHAHTQHWDYLCVIEGTVVVGLHDLRPAAPPARRSAIVTFTGNRPQVLSIPPGVAHGFYSPERSVYFLGASGYYDPSDHRRCCWDCPELGLNWPCATPILSRGDEHAPGYAQFRSGLLAALVPA